MRSAKLVCVGLAGLALIGALLTAAPWARPRGTDAYPWVLWAVATGRTVADDAGAPVAEFVDLSESPGGPRPRHDYRVTRDTDGRPCFTQERERSILERMRVVHVTHCGMPLMLRAVGVTRPGPDGRTWTAFLTAPYFDFGDPLTGDEDHDERCVGIWEITTEGAPAWRVELLRYGGYRGGDGSQVQVAPDWGVRGDVLLFVPESDRDACIGLLSADGRSFTGFSGFARATGRRVE